MEGEEEFLFAPYSVFTVLSVAMPASGKANASNPIVIQLQAAVDNRVPRLVFMLDEALSWPPSFLDAYTGAGDAGKRIAEFRKRIAEDRLASMFTSPEDLAAKVAAAMPEVPVSVTWSREEDMTHDFYRPMQVDIDEETLQAVATTTGACPATIFVTLYVWL